MREKALDLMYILYTHNSFFRSDIFGRETYKSINWFDAWRSFQIWSIWWSFNPTTKTHSTNSSLFSSNATIYTKNQHSFVKILHSMNKPINELSGFWRILNAMLEQKKYWELTPQERRCIKFLATHKFFI